MSEKKEKKKVGRASLRRAFTNIVWPRRKLLLLGLLLIIVNRLAGLVLPGSSKYLIDEIIDKNQLGLLYPMLAAVFLAVAVQAISSFILTRLLSVEAQNLIKELRIRVQQHILKLPIHFYDENRAGSLVSRIMNDVEGVRNLVGTGLVQLIGGVITSVLALVILINLNPLLTLIALGPMAIFAFISMKAFAYIRPIFRERGKIMAEVTGRLTESLNGARVIKGFNAEEQEISTFSTGVERIFSNVKKTLTSTALISSSATLLLGVASVLIMGLGATDIAADKMTVGDFFAFTLFLGFMVAPIIQMSNIGSQITEALAGLDRTEEILAQTREGDEDGRDKQLPLVSGKLEFKDVHFSYEENEEVLHGISFLSQPGSVTALVGSSGSGKSTIASLAATFLSPTDGSILIDDVDLNSVKLSSYRSQLGVVLQDDFLFQGTIKENIAFSAQDATDEEIQAAADAAYVTHFADQFELGLETIIGERGVKLSGGQRQRIAIARAILANPRILLLDEATSNLDNESEAYIQKSLETLMKGRTTLVIAHRLSTIRRADQILVIENGSIGEQGKHEELLEKKGRYFELYSYQARI